MIEIINLTDLRDERAHLRDAAKHDQLTPEGRERLDAINALDTELPLGLVETAALGRFLVAEDDWEEFVRDDVEGEGDIPSILDTHIDWAGVANSVRQDWYEVDFDERSYLVRS